MSGSGRSWRLLLIFTFVASGACCGPSSRELHICLGVYLERDFPLLETLVEQRRGRVILEGPDLQDLCRHVSSLRSCYAGLLHECDSAWKLDAFARLSGLLGATHDHLCHNGTDNLRDLLLSSGCLTAAAAHCPGFDWRLSWRGVLRMQESPPDRCPDLRRYRDCLDRHLACGKESYVGLLDVWLTSWCGLGSPDSSFLYYAPSVSWPSEDEPD